MSLRRTELRACREQTVERDWSFQKILGRLVTVTLTGILPLVERRTVASCSGPFLCALRRE